MGGLSYEGEESVYSGEGGIGGEPRLKLVGIYSCILQQEYAGGDEGSGTDRPRVVGGQNVHFRSESR